MMRPKETLASNNTASKQYKSSHVSNESVDMNVQMVARVAVHPTVHPFMCNGNELTLFGDYLRENAKLNPVETLGIYRTPGGGVLLGPTGMHYFGIA